MIIIGDVHGNFDTLVALINKIPKEERDKGIVLAGDLIDRGPKSAEVVQFCIDNSNLIKVVTGNHEQMMVDEGLPEAAYFMRNGTFNMSGSAGIYGGGGPGLWLMNGGMETLDSYVGESETEFDFDNRPKKVFDLETFVDHQEWMKKLPLYLEFKDVKNEKGEHLLVTHSSACRVWKWNEERRKDQHKHFNANIVWGRPHSITPIPSIYNVFGHTPVSPVRIRETYANIDSGCFYYGEPGYFKLTALQFPEMIVYEQENIDIKRKD
jgi:serine/threonine protein phosphatase 1